MTIDPLEQLKEWMIANCYNDNTFAIGTNIYEGWVLDKKDELFRWYYTERNNQSNFQYFANEKEAVEYAFLQINGCETALRHIVGFIKDSPNKIQETELLKELEKRNIKFFKDQIPYNIGDIRIRVFVYGCDIKKVLDLQEKYYKKSG